MDYIVVSMILPWVRSTNIVTCRISASVGVAM
jgi:hypothetical protein